MVSGSSSTQSRLAWFNKNDCTSPDAQRVQGFTQAGFLGIRFLPKGLKRRLKKSMRGLGPFDS